MQGTKVSTGNSIDYTPSSAVAAGQVVIQGSLPGIATLPIAANALGSLDVEGIFDVVAATEEITVGAAVYWDADGNPVGGTAGTGAATATSSGNTLIGYAIAAKAAGGAIVRTKLK